MAFQNCFNSQRDGILPGEAEALRSTETVSIPNGMEFYLTSGVISRDFEMFQFPTGWNSTIAASAQEVKKSIVSIPNGMEFYMRACLFLSEIWCFNSQRDGILPMLSLACRLAKVFQFPTGWNSTLSAVFKKLEIALFQFPTGWNSTIVLYWQ